MRITPTKMLFTALFLFLLSGSKAQQNVQLINSGDAIRKGIELHDKEDYDGALREYAKVERNDTNYALCLVEMATTYLAAGKDSLALIVCNKGIAINGEYLHSFHLYKGTALDNLGKFEASIAAYKEGMKRYPKNNLFYFEIGTAYGKQKNYEEAKKYFTRSIELNPYHPGSHYQLGIISLQQGKIVPAMMALQFFLILEAKTPRAKKTVSTLENLVKGEFSFEGAVPDKSLADGEEDFSELETIIKSKMALSEKYKAKSDLEYALVKQIQVFLEKSAVNKGDKSFFARVYAPFYSELYKKDFFEPFIYNILSGMEVEKIDKWVARHDGDYKKFAVWAVDYIGNTIAYTEEDMGGQKIKVRHWYENSKLTAEGNEDAAKKLTGPWKFYYTSGQLKSEGLFDKTGEKTGTWKFYYSNGNLSDVGAFKNAKYEGQKQEYYESGALKTKLNYKDGLLDGENIAYYESGNIKGNYMYKEGKQNGAEIIYFKNGKKNSELNFVENAVVGELKLYYESGNPIESSPLEKGKRNGLTTEYHDMPGMKKKSEGMYKDGLQTGDWKTWHKNGKIKEEGKYNDKGLKSGTWKTWSEEGVQEDETGYTESGKLTGVYKMFDKGKEYVIYDYKNGELTGYKFFDKDGKTIAEAKKSGKTFPYTFYFPNGSKKKEGIFKNDLQDGEVKYYNENNFNDVTEKYSEGLLEGVTTYYHENGKPKSTLEYSGNAANGYFKRWYSNGVLETEGWYKEGLMQGTWISYFPSGKKSSEKYYLNDNIYGWQTFYFASGKKEREEQYLSGVNTAIVYFDSLGTVSDSVLLKWGNGDLVMHFYNSKQIYINGKRKGGELDGKYMRYFFNGKTEMEAEYSYGYQTGPYKLFWLNGKPRVEGTYKNGNREGLYKTWYESGTIEHEWFYAEGTEEGVQKNYHPNGKLAREADYKKGKAEGFIKLYAEDGALIYQRKYENDRLTEYAYLDKTGKMTAPVILKDETANVVAYYQTGQKSLEATYKNGVLEGKRTEYFSNGKLSKEEFYICGQEHGLQKYYFAGGQIKSEENFLNGDRFGSSKFYFENGKTESEREYTDDSATGTWKFYNNTGKLIKTQTWYNGLLLNEKNM
ncbi:MAG: tetratricopeptide repeat protein [Bacteroidia bacterium]|nr:tetratricopeptide repeat protein [Bacteroidia bacterium]